MIHPMGARLGTGPGAACAPQSEVSDFRIALARTILLTIVVASTLIDLFFFTGFYSSDDATYLLLPHHILQHGCLPEGSEFEVSCRLSILGWNVFLMWLVGPSAQVIAASYVVFHQVLICLTYALASRVLDRRTGLLAVYGAAFCPLLVTYSTTVVPDLMLACCFILAIYAFLRAYDPGRPRVSDPRVSPAWMFIAGAAVGVAYLTKESGLILLPFCFCMWVVFSRRRSPGTALYTGSLFVLGAALAYVVEWYVLSSLRQRPVVRLASAVGELDLATRAHIARYGVDPLERLNWVGVRLSEFFGFIPFWIKIVLLCGLVVYPLLRRSRWPILLLPIWVFVYQTWGTMQLTEYFPPSIKARYYIPVIPFVAIVESFVALSLLRWLGRRGGGWLAGRPVRAVVVACLLALPIAGLQVCDEKAGRLYRAEEIGGTMEAIRWARNQGGAEPIVLSAYVSHRLDGYLLGSSVEGIRQARDLGREELLALVAAGGFYYFDIPGRYKPGMPNCEIDTLLRWSSDAPQSFSENSEFADAEISWCPEADGADRFRIGDYEVLSRNIGSFHQLVTRSAEAQVTFGHALVQSSKVKPPGSRAARLWKVTGAKCGGASEGSEPVEHENAADRAANDAAELRASGDSAPVAPRWHVMYPSRFSKLPRSSDVPPFEMIEIENGGSHLVLNLVPDSYLWLAPDGGQTLALDRRRRYGFELAAVVDRSVNAELRFEMFGDAARRLLLSRKRIQLGSGVTRFGIQTERSTVYIKTAFKLSGAGAFELNRFVMHGDVPPE